MVPMETPVASSSPRLRPAIAKGKPLIAGFNGGAVTTPVGGHAAGKV
jgi:hypothetical protein